MNKNYKISEEHENFEDILRKSSASNLAVHIQHLHPQAVVSPHQEKSLRQISFLHMDSQI